jgi:single-stranded-DNA-specific exonuclease
MLDLKPKPSEDCKTFGDSLKCRRFWPTLVQRGINTFEEAKAFFRPSLDNLHDPYLMKDMEKAVNASRKQSKTKKIFLFWRL